jgi:hypothetical protein
VAAWQRQQSAKLGSESRKGNSTETERARAI